MHPLSRLIFVCAVPLSLVACGDLPQPFLGYPGATAMKLRNPPPARLDILPPEGGTLNAAQRAAFATTLADILQSREVPAVMRTKTEGDWGVRTTLAVRGDQVVPTYTLLDQGGAEKGHAEGKAVPLAVLVSDNPTQLKEPAGDASLAVTDMLDVVNVKAMQADPHSLYNRAAKIYLPRITGAPGDGNTSLTLQMKRALVQLGNQVQDTQEGADFTVVGHIDTAIEANKQMRVEIIWKLSDAAGHDLGLVAQLNEVPPASLSGYWGEVAIAIATQAAAGVQETVRRVSGHREPQAAAATLPPQPPTKP